ncbi:hypothetical protein [Neobacillus bataviensis]|uniref:hypothetical protein n=1 Tax=Neobacillus bataviensis TaxID=220685 RepID=UPI001CBDC085|nr:hypothetical protein [Neobacillus bataviensis]
MGTENFSSTLDLLLGFNVNLYVGEEVYKGKLIGVEPDHVILESENNYIFYYSLDQVQAITKNTKQFQGEDTETEFLKTQSLTEVLNSLKQSWVTILCLNKRSFNGILSHVNSDYATLISGEERILIKLTHISNILKGFIQENENSSSNQSEKQDNIKAEDNKKEKNAKVTAQVTAQVASTESSKQPVASSSNESKAEKKSEEIVKVISEEKEQQTKVWSQSIKNVTKKLNEVTTQKINNEMRKHKEEQVQNIQKQERQRAVENIQKHEKQRAVENKNTHIKEEKPAPQKVVTEPKVVTEAKVVTEPKVVTEAKEVQVTQKQEPIAPVYKSKEIVTIPKQAAEEKRNEPAQNKKDETRKVEQPVRGFRFSGEPVTPREMERTSFFSGWPNRSNKTRF